jgi:hypothetical protein
MNQQQDFIRKEIQVLDGEIEKAKEIISKMEKSQDYASDKTYQVVKTKMRDWTNKRNVLLEIVIKQISK